MRGDRSARGLINRAGKIEGTNYTGDPAASVTAWGGGDAGVSTPAIGQYPTVTIPIDDDDDGSDTMDRIDQTARGDRNSTRDTTKNRFRTQYKSLANWAALLSRAATRTDSNFYLEDDFAGTALDTTKWATAGTAPAIVDDSANGSLGALNFPASSGSSSELKTGNLALGTKDFAFAARFRFHTFDPAHSSLSVQLAFKYAFTANNGAATMQFASVDAGVVLDTGIALTDTAYHFVRVQRIGGLVTVTVDGTKLAPFADASDSGVVYFDVIAAADVSHSTSVYVDAVKLFVGR